MSDRPVGVLVEDMLERIDRISRYTRGLDHDAFVNDEKTIDAVVRSFEVIGEAAGASRRSSEPGTARFRGIRLPGSATESSTSTSTSTSG